MIRVLVADDSAFMRRVITDLFKSQNDFEVIDVAKDGREAVEKTLNLKPDLLTLDINMPVMDGLEALDSIMKECPTPVVMVSSLTKEGSEATIAALSLGAIDFICKPNGAISKIDAIADEILTKCRTAAIVGKRGAIGAKASAMGKMTARKLAGTLRLTLPEKKTFTPTRQTVTLNRGSIRQAIKSVMPTSRSSPQGRFVVLGCSTGGPSALQELLPRLPKDLPCGVLVVQHMPAGFTLSLAKRLNEISAIKVKEASDHEKIEAGTVYIAPGGYHMTVEPIEGGREISLNQSPPLGKLRPAADILFDSATKYGNDVVSVILTGMGSDGANGMEKIKAAGGYVIAESEETCIVYGMPKSVVERGLADEILPINEIADAIVKALKR